MTRAGVRVPRPKWVEEILPEHLLPDALNIVVFGPGRGEAILVVLPDGRIGVVDGCREPDKDGRGDPVRELLDHLERERSSRNQPGLRLRFVCLTHPHGDHYGGLARLLQAYETRVDEVWCPFKTGDRYAEQYLDWIRCSQEPTALPDRDDPKGLDRVFAEMRRPHTDVTPAPQLLHQGMDLLREKVDGTELIIHGVGPSTSDMDDAQDALLKALASLESSGRGSPRFDPNDASGALLIRWGKAQVLLAGDLTRGKDPLRGWQSAMGRITGRVQVVNVAHHASVGAHHEALWATMEPALAIVTPFQRARGNQPPRPEDIDRLADSNAKVVITARPAWDWDEPGATLPVPESHDQCRQTGRGRGSKNKVLVSSPAPGFDARRNAAAVALNRRGTVLQLVLAGEANLYRHSRTRR